MRTLLLLLLLAAPAHAQPFHEGRAIVTGTDARMRDGGMRQGLRQVLARVAGDPALETDPRVDALDLAPLLLSFAYTDRMGLLPRQDEQGSRDRPYDLLTQWDPLGVAGVLGTLGLRAWPAEARPAVAVRVRVAPRVGGTFDLTPDGDVDERHRASLWDAGARYGLVLRLGAPPGPATLDGALRWVDGEGWHASWRLQYPAGSAQWEHGGGSFDEAYRNGVGEAVKLLATEWRK